MAEKPKHKPNTKHTLEEVLKSLHDLIRNDLVAADTVLPKTGHPPAPPVREAPDEFNAALDKLDEIITHNIVGPVERARRLPPAPPAIVDDIPWSEDEPAVEDDAVAGSDVSDSGDENIVLESSDDTIEIEGVPPEEMQETFSFNGSPATTEAPGEGQRTPSSFEVVELDGPGVEPSTPADAPVPASDESDVPRVTQEWEQAATIEFSVSPEPTETLPDAAPTAVPLAAEDSVPDAAAAELRPPPLFAEPARTSAPAEPPPIIQKPSLSTIASNDDIPVLNEVAHEILAQTQGAPPSPERIREITIQVAARLNVELRQSGGQPLDARTIIRLQQLLQQALSQAPKNDDRS